MHFAFTLLLALALLHGSVGALPSSQNAPKARPNPIPPPPKLEPISLVTLPLPPIAPSNAVGACTSSINPHGTGCLVQNGSWTSGTSFQAGDFLPDGHHIVALVTFSGAPAAPAPASIYSGEQIIILKTDGTTFKNGDTWKCITCGVPAQNKVGMNAALDYPQAFTDGRRLLVGTNVIDCHGSLISESCTRKSTFIYPLRWNATADGSGAGGIMRELRLHPDSVHLMFNTFGSSPSGSFGEYVFIARLDFNAAPKTGLPLAPRYDLGSVYLLVDPTAQPAITAVGNKLVINSSTIAVGEGRGFASRGAEVTQVGFPMESCNADLTAFDLTTGAWRRLTEHPEYADPMHTSPDGEWMVIEDTRGSGRQMFLAGMRYVPPITDMLSVIVTTSFRNNGGRRFMEPYLLDKYGDRGTYFGQKINGDNNGVQGSGTINDPEWNALADPRWSPNGRQIVFWQALASPPACGGANPLPCYTSKEPGKANYRVLIATLTSRKATVAPPVKPASDVVPWGTPYVPGSSFPETKQLPAGNYTLDGKFCGKADVQIIYSSPTAISTIAVTYTRFSDDGLHFLDGTESVSIGSPADPATPGVHCDWFSDLMQSGKTNATKKTSPEGFHVDIDPFTNIFVANGTLTTVVDGVSYFQPVNQG